MFNWLKKINGWLLFILACFIPIVSSIIYSSSLLSDFEYMELLRNIIYAFLFVAISLFLLFIQLTEYSIFKSKYTIYNIKNHICALIFISTMCVCFYIVNDSVQGVVELQLENIYLEQYYDHNESKE